MTKEKIVKIVEGKEKIQNLVITFDEYQYEDDFDAEPKFQIREANDIRGYQVNGDLLAVSFKDDSSFILPMRRIRSIEVNFTEKE